ncbi:nitrate reductase (NADPH) [Wickerhamomyces ciferrii]|uniref:Nitrate reductase n=1 Tax=Wickerhamomyces ciferrii (strain ATCC 14091 / BCRC 22168 / CBS 111 / JCM 3599 / NBRC 0793 / NRRL Y-1031 F-60-10) TaxID=1206466 RepID=K0KL21_WICCF|nr:nitrate reductase (NADPH) [Wickerhamomyces ciferrii]CCH42867.1 nitrate reductase (NADPH) [Wickerhamomyces ciferrii]
MSLVDKAIESSLETQTESSIFSDASSSHVSESDVETLDQILGKLPIRLDTKKTKVLDIDLQTKDNKVARDPRLLRLTGSHPFNCEAPLTDLFNDGFITSSDLHFVRNHGPVPHVEDEGVLGWNFSVSGDVSSPFEMNIGAMIKEFPQYTNPITICCAGNRRKEQNQVKKGKGFNWGAAGVSTSLWTGCFLWDVIQRANPSKKARYLWMEGGDDPAKGAYGTCIPLHMVRDPERNIMLAYKQNGIYLEPDHGKPLRCVIPGVIGGRSVKWLKRLIVSEIPSDNWYHFYDNRVLPTMVTPEMAATQDHWWKDERYAIYDLNLQSITVFPENEERMIINDSTQNDLYKVKGFAYNGGGKRVGRVEVSLDSGKNWKLCNLNYPEDKFRDAGYIELFGGTINVCERMSCLCWCFWDIEIPKSEFKDSTGLVVRAMDISMTVQPRTMYWNVTSMLNNWWYRVAIQPGSSPDEIKFEHPTIANKPGGWMDRVKKDGGDILSNTWGERVIGGEEEERKEYVDEELQMILNPEKVNTIITKEELSQHENDEDPWFVVKGHVFTGTPFLEEHPGGAQSITMVAGDDATDDFMAIHSDNSKRMLQKFHIGKLEVSDDKKFVENTNKVIEKTATLLNPKIWKKIKLVEKEIISHDSRIFHFALEHEEQTTGLPVGKHFFIRSKDSNGTLVMRAYTPKSNHKLKGKLEVLVKIYFPKDGIPGGKMTTILESMSIGSEIEIKGPTGEFEYISNGNYTFNNKPGHVDSFFMIAGGSGITPCYQVIKEIVDQEEDNTKMKMFYGNRKEEDILCRKDLEDFIATKNSNLIVDHCLSDFHNVPKNWDGLTGRLNKLLWNQYIEEQKSYGEFLVLVCGPPGMVEGVKKLVAETGFDASRVVYF